MYAIKASVAEVGWRLRLRLSEHLECELAVMLKF